MAGITDAVDALAAHLGLRVDWTRLHHHLNTAPVAALLSAASRAQSHGHTVDRHQRDINDLLDHPGDETANHEDTHLVAAALADLILTSHEQRQTAIDQAHDLVDALTDLGVLTPPT
ncbi:hypothetical protein [Micromonospora yangpuensis]|uniref:Uncharacterized protein n=1 Tax=Micromonospora yangpuensis TaxID=683228 RepID=A0A1C6U438_9ACTN|nr:hypothetical protein [Micromonospora yangpuensis]GGL92981.1 hypothetical protein GCM10012279_08360 [Micromonospora yangpuensis]SCL48797.1 hypothetical protein GA0070617_0982 [Micromonospora yangpuensis]